MVMKGDDAFAEAMKAAYPHFKKRVQVPPDVENLSNKANKLPKPVERDVIHIMTKKYQQVQRTSFPYKLILNQIAFVSGITIREIKSPYRNKHIVRWRQIAMYLLSKHTDASLVMIGKRLGDRHHSTVKHGKEKIEANMPDYQEDIRKIEERL